jgi:CHAD domain-containing protein
MGAPETNLEREVKLDAGLRFELPELNGLVAGVVATRLPDARLQAIYVDTEDLRLMRWGVTLRHRRDTVGGAGAESGWTLKLPVEADGVALVRTELSWPGTFGPVPAEVASLVRAQARTARLVPVAKLLTERHRVELRDGDGRKLGEVDDDVVSVMDGRRLAARFRQVELEVTDAAPPELLDEVLQALTVAGAIAGDDRPKVVRAIGPRASLGPDVVVPALDSQSTVATVVSAAIASGVTRIIRHDPGVRLGDDPEHVHQARVGTRRLRSDLRTFWRLLDPEWAGPVRTELGWLAALLGGVRDADVLTGRLRSQIRSLGGVDAKAAAALLRRLAIEREEARVCLLEALDSARYLALLENLAVAAARPPLARNGSDAGAPLDPRDGDRFQGREPGLAGSGATPPGTATGAHGAAGAPVAAGAPAVSTAAAPGAGAARPAASHPAAVAGAAAARAAAAAAARAAAAGAGTSSAGPPPSGTNGRAAVTPAPSRTSGATGSRRLVLPAISAAGLTVALAPGDDSDTVGRQAVTTWPGQVRGRDDDGDLADQRAADVLPVLVRRPWKHLQQAVDQLGEDPPDEALHEIRIRAKRMRYAAEAVAGVIGKPARQLAVAVAGVQGVLGDMQDAVVAETWLRRQASSGPASRALVAGELVTLERQKQAACRKDWVRPWKTASKKSLRKWLKR